MGVWFFPEFCYIQHLNTLVSDGAAASEDFFENLGRILSQLNI